MSHPRSLAAAVATLAILVAIPATASAKSSARSGAPAVKAHVLKAKKALKKLTVAVNAHDDRAALSQLKSSRRHTAAAAKAARRMAARAGAGTPSVTAAASLTLAANQYDALAEQITALVDEITGQVQLAIAQSIPSAIAGKQQIVQILTTLLAKVPEAAKAPLASVIAALSLGDATEVVNLDEAIDGGTLPTNISAMLSQCLGMATQAIQTAFDTIKGILPMLPSAIQGPLGTILDMVSNTVGTIVPTVPTVLGTVTGLVDQILGSLPFVGAGSPAGLGNLLGGILGGPSAPGAGIPDIGGLLGGLFPSSGSNGNGSHGGGGPAAGIGGLVASITGMISGLLGGLLSH